MNHTGVHYTCARSLRDPHLVRPRRLRGFTLVELMITIAVAAILITIAVPSFQHIIASNKLTATANSLVGALNTARMSAIKRNADAQFCSNNSGSNGTDTLGTACAAQGGAVYVLMETASAATAATQVQAPPVITQGQQHLVGNIMPLRFDAQGLAHKLNETAPYGGPVAVICTEAMSSNNRRVVQMTTGSIIAVATSVGACP